MAFVCDGKESRRIERKRKEKILLVGRRESEVRDGRRSGEDGPEEFMSPAEFIRFGDMGDFQTRLSILNERRKRQ